MSKHTLGIDLGVRAAHVATLCDERGEGIWSKQRCGNRHQELGHRDHAHPLATPAYNRHYVRFLTPWNRRT